MKIIFMGTPLFAVPALEKLAASRHEVGYVFTQPDKAKDRGKKIHFSPVKEKALELQIPVVQPEKIKGNTEILDFIKSYHPDLIVVAAYGQILPKEMLEIPSLGCINIHASLLPKYRGAAPIQRAIMEGEKVTGVTLMQMAEGLDTGDMLAKAEIPAEGKTFQELHDELSQLGCNLLMDNLDAIEKKEIPPVRQDDAKATYAHMIFKKDALIDFNKSAKEIEQQIRGLNPIPGAHTSYKGETMKIFRAREMEEKVAAAECGNTMAEPGQILKISKEGMYIRTGDGILFATEIQMPNKRRMLVEEFLRGHKMDLCVVLGK